MPSGEECAELDGFDAPPGRQNNSKRTRASILAAGRAVFAEKGYSGANVAEIVSRAQTTKPMIYYHFGSKEGLFAAVLEEVYAGMRAFDESVDISGIPPVEAMRRLIQVTFDYHAQHPDWVRLIAVANIHDARHIIGSATIAARNAAVVDIVAALLARGEADGAFRSGVDPLHLHMLIASFCFYRVSNRHTWGIIFKRDLWTAGETARQRAMVEDAVLQYLTSDAAPSAPELG